MTVKKYKLKDNKIVLSAYIEGYIMNKKQLGKKVNIARKDCGLTGEKLAEACHINPTYLRQIESGTKIPSLPVFVTICKELRVSPSYLLSEVLEDCDLIEMDMLIDLWQCATPRQIKLITAMIKSALAIVDSQ